MRQRIPYKLDVVVCALLLTLIVCNVWLFFVMHRLHQPQEQINNAQKDMESVRQKLQVTLQALKWCRYGKYAEQIVFKGNASAEDASSHSPVKLIDNSLVMHRLQPQEQINKTKTRRDGKHVHQTAKTVNTSLYSSANLAENSFLIKLFPHQELNETSNKQWWHKQFRQVDILTLPDYDPLLHYGITMSELFSARLESPPLDHLLTGYVQMHQNVISQHTKDTQDKVVNVFPNAQMANRLRITVFALTVGLLLDKAVHVRFSNGWHAALHDILTPIVDIQADALHGKHGQEMSLEAALCHDWNTSRVQNAGIFLRGNSYMTSLLIHNAKLKQRFKKVFGDYKDFYRMVFTRFFRPSPEIVRKLSDFRFRHHLQQKIVIGVHVRSGGDFRKPMTSDDWAHFRECAEMMTARVKARNTIAGVNVQTEDVVWLVVTDTQEARSRSIKEFESNIHKANILFYDNFRISNNKQGVQNAFMDMLLVTFADARVLTPCSSYSEFAFTMAGATGDSVFVQSASSDGPHNCYSERREVVHPFCFRPQSLDPSFEELEATLKQNPSCVGKENDIDSPKETTVHNR